MHFRTLPKPRLETKILLACKHLQELSDPQRAVSAEKQRCMYIWAKAKQLPEERRKPKRSKVNCSCAYPPACL
jgi:hypothetical protein